MITDVDGKIEFVNPAFQTMTGFKPAEVIGRKPRILKSDQEHESTYKTMWQALAEKGRWQGEIWNQKKNGEAYPQWLNITHIKNAEGEIKHYIAIGHDVSDLKRSEDRLKHQAYHDPLTDLPNRCLFIDRMTTGMTRALRNRRKLVLLFLDLDHFKKINDRLGHLVGDLFLKAVANTLQGCLRKGDTVARLSGDEFTIIMEDLEHIEDAILLTEKILHLFDRPFVIKDQEVFSSVSIGISIFPSDGEDAETLIKNADIAMYAAKKAGRNNFQFFKSDMQTEIMERLTTENNLRKSLHQGEFKLFYQPVIDLIQGRLIGMEALIRWCRPGRKIELPGKFIPIAEEGGMIVPIGESVLRMACEQAAQWKSSGHVDLRVSVNLSARQFREKNLTQMIKSVLEETGLAAESLILEITETTAMDNMAASIRTMNQLRNIGIRIAMDDFGTGYSSFDYLKQFPINIVKLDHAFVHDIRQDADASKIASAIITLCKLLDLKVIAEGIETQHQLDFLSDQGCDEAQGFLFSKALSGEDFSEFLNQCKSSASFKKT